MLITTNSAGSKGAKPLTMLTIPRLMSFWVVVSESHFTKYAVLGLGADKGSLSKQVVHEGAHVEPDLRPEGLVVGLEHDPLSAPM